MNSPAESAVPPSDGCRPNHTDDHTLDALLAEVERELSSQASGQPNRQPPDPADLLAELQAEFTQKQTPPAAETLDLEGFAQQQRHPAPPETVDAAVSDLLAEVQAELSQRDRSPAPRSTAGPGDDVQALLSDLQSEFRQKPAPPIELPTGKPSAATDTVIAQMKRDFEATRHPPPPSPQIDHLLNDLKGEFKQLDTAAQIKQQETLLREHRQREWERQQRRQAIAQKAAAWLKDLDPYSDEGLWFEEFAYNYPSKQEAAIDYLEALWTQP